MPSYMYETTTELSAFIHTSLSLDSRLPQTLCALKREPRLTPHLTSPHPSACDSLLRQWSSHLIMAHLACETEALTWTLEVVKLPGIRSPIGSQCDLGLTETTLHVPAPFAD